MSNAYNIKEVRIELGRGLTLIAEISSIGSLKQLLKELEDEEIIFEKEPKRPALSRHANEPSVPDNIVEDTPEHRVEIRAQMESGALAKRSLLAFKDGVPQLLRPNALTGTDAVLALLFAVETGLKSNKVDYQSFRDLYEAQNIKIGSPVAMLLTNLRNGGYLDKKLYGEDRSIRLTAKGEKKAIEVLKGSHES